jgi:hypothetical protein
MSDPNHQILKEEVLDKGGITKTTTIRVERAGIFGLTSCEFDVKTGEHLSTTRPRETTLNVTGMLGIPGEVIDEEVSCPRRNRYKCQSCPERTTSPKILDELKTTMDPDQLANAQHLHGTIHGFS